MLNLFAFIFVNIVLFGMFKYPDRSEKWNMYNGMNIFSLDFILRVIIVNIGLFLTSAILGLSIFQIVK